MRVSASFTPTGVEEPRSAETVIASVTAGVTEVADSARILDFDIETLSAGFADPNWVPQKITAYAWGWVGEDSEIECKIVGKEAFWDHKLRGERIAHLADLIREADIVAGHNITRFDLPVLNAELIRCGQEPLRDPVRVIDTIRLPKAKGLKKGQDNLSTVLGVTEVKQGMTWAEWDEAYSVEGWPEVVSRVVGDVRQHMELMGAMRERNLLAKPSTWKGMR